MIFRAHSLSFSLSLSRARAHLWCDLLCKKIGKETCSVCVLSFIPPFVPCSSIITASTLYKYSGRKRRRRRLQPCNEKNTARSVPCVHAFYERRTVPASYVLHRRMQKLSGKEREIYGWGTKLASQPLFLSLAAAAVLLAAS